jgi:hypothetical protein
MAQGVRGNIVQTEEGSVTRSRSKGR